MTIMFLSWKSHMMNWKTNFIMLKLLPIKTLLQLMTISTKWTKYLTNYPNLLLKSIATHSQEQPFHQEGVESSHSMRFHSNPFVCDLHLPKVDVNKFDGFSPTSWVTQMEHYFSLHGITNDLMKLCVSVFYLDPKQWQWWQWHKNSHGGYIACTQFVADLYEWFELDTRHLGHLTKLKQSSIVEDYISSFEQLVFCIEGMSNTFFWEFFISGLKEEICTQVLMAHPTTWLKATQWAKEEKQVINAQIKRSSFILCPRPTNPSLPLKINKLTHTKMIECQLKGLCYNCDEKCFPRHKCTE